jgi:hypothetical protein
MPKENEGIFYQLPKLPDLNAGNSLYGVSGRSSREGVDLAYTTKGEFGAILSDGGELVATFSDQGMMYVYDNDGNILMMAANVCKYLSSMSMTELESMPNGGMDIIDFLTYMSERRLTMMMTASLGENRNFNVSVLDEDGETILSKDDEEVDFGGQGLSGEVILQGHKVMFEIMMYADDLMFALGEKGENRTELVAVEASLFVNYMEDMESDDPRRLINLANKIIL